MGINNQRTCIELLYSSARPGAARCGPVRPGAALCDPVWPGAVLHGHYPSIAIKVTFSCGDSPLCIKGS